MERNKNYLALTSGTPGCVSDPLDISCYSGIDAVFVFHGTLLSPAGYSSQKPGAFHFCGMWTSTISLACILCLVRMPCTEHAGHNREPCAPQAGCPINQLNLQDLENAGLPSLVCQPSPATHGACSKLEKAVREFLVCYANRSDITIQLQW